MSCSRRTFFSAFGRSVLDDLSHALASIEEIVALEDPVSHASPASKWLRPPGAVPETAFLRACTRCTACQEACPHHSIRRLGPEFGEAAGTPAIIPHESPCYLCEDMPCISACEPLVLQPISKAEIAMGTAVIHTSACYVAQGQPCDYCVVRCPLGPDAISFNGRGLPQVHEEGCSGCGVCAYLCPAKAVTIRPRA